jgi:hypothetical protein
MTTELVKKDSNSFPAIVFSSEQFKALILENLEGDLLSFSDLDKIKMPVGGSSSFVMASLSGEAEVKSFKGIILAQKTQRAYFEGEFTGEGTAPVCSSADGYRSCAGKLCHTCQYAQFGTNGKGQLCRLSKILFILQPENLLPAILSVPPSSLKGLKKYFLRLTSQRLPFNNVVTQFSTAKTQTPSGIKYSVLDFTLDSILNSEEALKIKSYADCLKPLLKGSESSEGVIEHNPAPAEIIPADQDIPY